MQYLIIKTNQQLPQDDAMNLSDYYVNNLYVFTFIHYFYVATPPCSTI